MDVGSSVATCKRISQMVMEYDFLYGALGIHPSEIRGVTDADLNLIKNEIINNPKIVAVGEIGLDYYYDFAPRQKQIEVLEKQIKFASSNIFKN